MIFNLSNLNQFISLLFPHLLRGLVMKHEILYEKVKHNVQVKLIAYFTRNEFGELEVLHELQVNNLSFRTAQMLCTLAKPNFKLLRSFVVQVHKHLARRGLTKRQRNEIMGLIGSILFKYLSYG